MRDEAEGGARSLSRSVGPVETVSVFCGNWKTTAGCKQRWDVLVEGMKGHLSYRYDDNYTGRLEFLMILYNCLNFRGLFISW